MEIGKRASLPVVRKTSAGLILDGDGREVLLAKRFAPAHGEVGDLLSVFIYTDSGGEPVATTQTPLAQADEFACLTVKAVMREGAFLDWGLEKDLLLPFGAQAKKVRHGGERWVVRVYCDPVSQRMMASSKLRRFLSEPAGNLREGQAVELLVYEATDLGVNAIVNDEFSGLLHCARDEAPPRVGTKCRGFIQRIRSDGKLDLSLARSGADARLDSGKAILEALRKAGGSLPLGDKSDPAEIQRILGMSKKAFKRAIGGLYRARRIEISDTEIRIRTPESRD